MSSENVGARIVFSNGRVTIGAFRARPTDPLFREDRLATAPMWVFPRLPVEIQHAGRSPVVADATTTVFYNRNQEYERRRLVDGGDACEWFSVSDDLLTQAMRPYAGGVDDPGEAPFRFSAAPSDAGTYLLQRSVFEYAAEASDPDALRIEEAVLQILEHVLAGAFGVHSERPSGRRMRADTDQAHEESARAVQTLLATRFAERWTLDDLAAAVHVSPYHLARLFRARRGQTIHAHLTQVRLREALERLRDSGDSITAIALDVGFSSHAHFTTTFRSAFGCTPSQARRSGGALLPAE